MKRKKIRVTIIDDSTFIRKALKRVISSDPQLEIVGEASNGEKALEIIRETSPDVVTLDFNMPGMNGLEVLERILEIKKIPVIMISAFTKRGGEITLKALERGAVDFVDKTSVQSPIEFVKLAGEIVNKIKAAANAKIPTVVSPLKKEKISQSKKYKPVDPSLLKFERIVLIGTSTGGPQALHYLIPSLPYDYPYPVVVIQHIPKFFSKSLAERLDSFSKVHVIETDDGLKIARGKVYIAKAGVHLYFKKKEKIYFIVHSGSPEDELHKPSINIAFSSAARIFKEECVGILLTGMGKDGAKGLLEIKKKGGITLAESYETAIIYGMPKAAKELGAAREVLTLPQIKEFLLTLPDEKNSGN